jgi:putative sterol carrier protein
MLIEVKTIQAEELMKTITKRIEDNSEKVKNWNNSVQFLFTDADPYWMKVTDGKVEKMEKSNRKHDAIVTLICTVEVLQKIVDGKLGAVMALVTRKIKVEGSILAIRELRQGVGIN